METRRRDLTEIIVIVQVGCCNEIVALVDLVGASVTLAVLDQSVDDQSHDRYARTDTRDKERQVELEGHMKRAGIGRMRGEHRGRYGSICLVLNGVALLS